jgi:protein arginine N-methyltransferase 2
MIIHLALPYPSQAQIVNLQIDNLFQNHTTPPAQHLIIEPHPQVLTHLRSHPIAKAQGVRILEGRWQDWLLDGEKLGEVLEMIGGEGFGGVFVDTFAEGYEGALNVARED